ncbi:MAG TPA: TadE family protein [Acidimicrobiales bacterium]|nr:TadE family protein [Acidimicrobiales bacterium]
MARPHRRARGERGAALVEFALIAPFLAILSLASIDLGRAYSLQHRLANASREGAAFAQYFPGQISSTATCVDPENIRYHALGEDGGVAAGFSVTVTNVDTGSTINGPCTLTGIAPGTRVKVTVTGTFRPVTPFGKQFVGSPATLRKSTQVVVQG